jgi:hypothetical protein
MLTLNVTNRIIMKITVWLIPTRQRFDNCLLKKFNYKKLLHPEYFSKRFLLSLPSRKTHSKFDPRVLGHLYISRAFRVFKDLHVLASKGYSRLRLRILVNLVSSLNNMVLFFQQSPKLNTIKIICR